MKHAAGLYLNFILQPHLLIGGTTGSGKSTVINGIIKTIIQRQAGQMVLIDPKRVELKDFKPCPAVVGYATETSDIIDHLHAAAVVMDKRFCRFLPGEKKTREPPLYVIIDELADLIQSAPVEAEKHIVKLARLGRAANVHLILATQSPSRKVITAPIKSNMTSRLALRCEEPIESRQIINRKGAEDLPRYGYGIYRTPEFIEPITVKIPII